MADTESRSESGYNHLVANMVHSASPDSVPTPSRCLPCEAKLTLSSMRGALPSQCRELSIELLGLGLQPGWSLRDAALARDVFDGVHPSVQHESPSVACELKVLAVKVCGRYLGPRHATLAPADRIAWNIIKDAADSPDISVRMAAWQSAEFSAGRSIGMAEGFLSQFLNDREPMLRLLGAQSLGLFSHGGGAP